MRRVVPLALVAVLGCDEKAPPAPVASAPASASSVPREAPSVEPAPQGAPMPGKRLADLRGVPAQLVAEQGWIYFDDAGHLRRVARTGGAVRQLVKLQGRLVSLAVHQGEVAWIETEEHAITGQYPSRVFLRETTGAVRLVEIGRAADAIAVDTRAVWWVDRSAAAVRRWDRGTGETETIVEEGLERARPGQPAALFLGPQAKLILHWGRSLFSIDAVGKSAKKVHASIPAVVQQGEELVAVRGVQREVLKIRIAYPEKTAPPLFADGCVNRALPTRRGIVTLSKAEDPCGSRVRPARWGAPPADPGWSVAGTVVDEAASDEDAAYLVVAQPPNGAALFAVVVP